MRPDPDGTPLERFAPPPVPEEATTGDDAGYSAEEEPEAAGDGAYATADAPAASASQSAVSSGS